MKLEDAIESMSRRAPEWDDLQQRRLLNSVRATHRRKLASRRKIRRLTGGAAIVVAALAFGAWGLGTIFGAEKTRPAVLTGISFDEVSPSGGYGQSVLSLADGSVAVLDEGSVVDTQIQTPTLVRLAQRRGRVHYDVKASAGRVFVVHVGAYQVRVLGTVFSVRLTTERMHVDVEQGQVEIEDSDRTLVLGPGERVDLPRAGSAVGMSVAPPVSGVQASSGGPAPLEQGETGDREAEESPVPDEKDLPSVAALLRQADRARSAGRLRDAALALRTVIRSHKRDPRVPSASFMLGRVERRRGKHAAAARAFRQTWKRAPSSALAEDARAEEALSWKAAGAQDRAIEAATTYLELFPKGTHRARVRAIVR